MKKKFVIVFIIIIALVSLFLLLPSSDVDEASNQYSLQNLPDSPLSATYNIYSKEITLLDGVYEQDDVVVSVVAGPVYGEVNDDDMEDAALVLVYSQGATTTYHLAVALGDSGYLGLNALQLEREDEPITLSIEDLSVVVSYRPEQLELSHTENEYYTLTSGLELINKTPETEHTIYKGVYVYGHESRVFTPCKSDKNYWISPESRSNAALKAVYEQKTRDLEPYTPIYIVLSGFVTEGTGDGFGADFAESIHIDNILSIPENGMCVVDHISTQ